MINHRIVVLPTLLATEVLSLQTGSFVGQDFCELSRAAVLVLKNLLLECWL
jgi:hypothetical protein